MSFAEQDTQELEQMCTFDAKSRIRPSTWIKSAFKTWQAHSSCYTWEASCCHQIFQLWQQTQKDAWGL